MLKKTNIIPLTIMTIILLIIGHFVTEARAAETLMTTTGSVRAERLVLEQVESSASIPPCETYSCEEQEEVVEEEKELLSTLTKVIYVEARGECYEGQVAVAASVLNRLESEKFPDTIEEVLEAYASIDNVTEEMLEKYPQCQGAAIEALNGVDPVEEFLGGPTFFFYCPELSDPEIVAQLENIETTYKIGNHVFLNEWAS